MPSVSSGSDIERRQRARETAWLDASLPSLPPVVALVGAGAGYALEALRERAPATRVLVLEPNPVTADTVLRHGDFTEWLNTGQLAILTGPAYEGATTIARQFPGLHTAPVLVHPDLATDWPAEVEHARRTLMKLAFDTSANDSAKRASAGRYLLHTLSNTPRLARESDIGALCNLAQGLPAIVVAAGPSLDRNIHDIAPVRDRAIVIACDTAARPLSLVGLEPDFIVASDPSRVNAAHLVGLPTTRCWLVAEASVHPSALTHFDRRTFFFRVSDHQPWPWLSSMGLSRGLLTTWGSVATSAFSLAVAMGCNPIVFSGADFAFTGDRPYCRGTSYESQWAVWTAGTDDLPALWRTLVNRWPAVEEADLDGRSVRTAKHLVSFRNWVVEQATRLPDRRIINATGAGLLHGGPIVQQTAHAALGPLPPMDASIVHQVIREAHASVHGDPARALQEIERVLGTGSDPHRRDWRAFTDGAVSDPAIDAALKSSDYLAWALARQALPRA